MLDMGFEPEIAKILAEATEASQSQGKLGVQESLAAIP